MFRGTKRALHLPDGVAGQSEELLKQVSGGSMSPDDPMRYGRCPVCGMLLGKTAGGYQCMRCGRKFDGNKNLIS